MAIELKTVLPKVCRDVEACIGVAELLPTYAGLLLSTEITGLNRVLEKPKKPLVVVLGGAKMETKIPVLKKLLPLADYILVGGGLANTYYLSKGYKIGKSLAEKKFVSEMAVLGKKKKIIFPIDAVYGTEGGTKVGVVSVGSGFKLPSQSLGVYDIGPGTIQLFAKYIQKAETIVWNGALGYFEQSPYRFGTYAIAQAIAARAKGKAFGVAGGGETVEVIKKLGLLKAIDLVSTGGGAMLEFLSGVKLPGVEAVTKK
jgi:phosphoglycerate kinase